MQVNDKSVVDCDHHLVVQALKDAGIDIRLQVSRETFVSATEEVNYFTCVVLYYYTTLHYIVNITMSWSVLNVTVNVLMCGNS